MRVCVGERKGMEADGIIIWQVNLPKARDIEGISNRQRAVAIYGRDPFSDRGPATRITISEVRMDPDDSEILAYLKSS